MNKKLLALSAAILMVLTLVMVPGFGLLPPGEEPDPEIAVKIEGDWKHTAPPPGYDPDEWPGPYGPGWYYCMDIPDMEDHPEFAPFELEAPAFSTTFNVEIWLLNVTKLYAYEFRLIWNYGWLDLQSWSLVDLGDGMGEQHVVDGDDFTPGMQPVFVQVWTHLGAVEGFSGSAKVADLVFHVHQDPVDSENDPFYSAIYIVSSEAVGPTTNPIELEPKHGIVKLVPTEPEAFLTPEDLIIIWEQDKQVTFKVNVENVIKMKSFELCFHWNETEGEFPTQLILDPQKHPVVVTDFLPGPYEYYEIEIDDTNVYVDVVRDCDKPAINGTGVLAEITLTAITPWGYKTTSIPEMCYEKERKVVPPYDFIETVEGKVVHDWIPDECHDLIDACLVIDGIYCYQVDTPIHYDPNQDVYAWYMGYYNFTAAGGIVMGSQWDVDTYYDYLPIDEVLYDFRPISGDFDMSGHVGLEDLMALAEWYGYDDTFPYWDCIDDFDIAKYDTDWPFHDSDDEIDIFDLTVVAKHFCQDTPFHWAWEEPYLDP